MPACRGALGIRQEHMDRHGDAFRLQRDEDRPLFEMPGGRRYLSQLLT